NASQKGWQEAAEKEMLEAVAVKPDYADAHFNLAVIYATASPPSKELAKRHYTKATELGAEPDGSLEKLLHWRSELNLLHKQTHGEVEPSRGLQHLVRSSQFIAV